MTKKIPRVFTRGKKSVVLFKIAGIELIILAVLGNQLVVRAALDDAALFEHHDAVAVAHGGKAVRDDKRGAALHQGIHARLHERLGAGIDGAGRFIENQHGRIGDGRARDGEQLTLALPCGNLVLSVAVLAILLTAPLGAIGMDATADRLLQK